jgi:cell wall-associated NlpC family hydrolase
MPATHQKNNTQLETFRDVDLDAFTLQMRNKAGINVEESITDAQIARTIEGASTLTVTCDDDLDRTIQQSGKLGRKVDVNVDGLWFTLVAVSKQGRSVQLTFEDRNVNALRYYDSWKMVNRSQVTRAQFVAWMIKEVKEFNIPYIIPELTTKQPQGNLLPGDVFIDPSGQVIGRYSPEGRPGGIPTSPTPSKIPMVYNLQDRDGKAATPEQVANASLVLDTGVALGARRKVLVVSIMTIMDEANLINVIGGDQESTGIFQQQARYGWPASRDIVRDATAFFDKAIAEDKKNPNLPYTLLAHNVQLNKDPNVYAQFQARAEAYVNAYGITGAGPGGSGDNAADPSYANNSQPRGGAAGSAGTTTGKPAIPWTPQTGAAGDYQFYRGNITADPGGSGNWILKKENSWDCMKRLANEVNWRAFCVSGTIYFVSEKWLFMSKPFMVISEDTDGIDWIDYDYDEGKRSATITVTCHIHRWSAPPGSTVQIYDMGIPNGKWLVNDVSRSLFDDIGTITLKKPQPILPEPKGSTQQSPQFGSVPGAKIPGERDYVPPGNYPGAALNPGEQAPAPGSAAARAVAYAKQQLGDPYKWAGAGPSAFDCSGLTMAAYGISNINLPHLAQAQYDMGPKVPGVAYLQPGDLVFFDTDNIPPQAGNVGHCGIYIGGGQFIHAPHTGDVVKVSELNSQYYAAHYVGATRPSG